MSTNVTAWYYDAKSNLTFRWQRGAAHMQVYPGNHLAGGAATQRVVAQVSVPSNGWLDEGEVASHAGAWLASKGHCSTCGSRLRRGERHHAF